MEHHGARRSLLLQDAQHIGVRLPVVDHQGLASALGDLDVLAEPPTLDVRGGVIAVVVEPRLTDRDHPRQPGQRLDLRKHLRRGNWGSSGVAGLSWFTGFLGLAGFLGFSRRRDGGDGVVRVDRHRRVHPVVLGGAPRRPAGGLQAGADRDDARDPRRPRLSEHCC